MAVTAIKSPEVQRADGDSLAVATYPRSGHLKMRRFAFAQGAAAGDANSTQALIYIPRGLRYVVSFEVVWSAFGASRVLDLGYAAYTKTDGTAVAAAAAGIKDDLDVSAAGTARYFLNTEFSSTGKGILITGLVAGGTIPANATISGCLLYE